MNIPVYSCTERRWSKRLKYRMHDDHGKLRVGGGGWHFEGCKANTHAAQITKVALERQPYPWGKGVFGLIALAIWISATLLTVPDNTDWVSFIEWAPALEVGLLIAFWVAILMLWVVLVAKWRGTHWLVLQGLDQSGQPVVGRYYARVRTGLVGQVGKNKALAEQIEAHLTEHHGA